MNAFQRKFVNEIRRCEEMERKLSKYKTELINVLLFNINININIVIIIYNNNSN